jgi:hypothetical protein
MEHAGVEGSNKESPWVLHPVHSPSIRSAQQEHNAPSLEIQDGDGESDRILLQNGAPAPFLKSLLLLLQCTQSCLRRVKAEFPTGLIAE